MSPFEIHTNHMGTIGLEPGELTKAIPEYRSDGQPSQSSQICSAHIMKGEPILLIQTSYENDSVKSAALSQARETIVILVTDTPTDGSKLGLEIWGIGLIEYWHENYVE